MNFVRSSVISSLDRSSIGSEAFSAARDSISTMGGIYVFDTSMAVNEGKALGRGYLVGELVIIFLYRI